MERDELEVLLETAETDQIFGIRLPRGISGERRWIIVGKEHPDPINHYSPSALSEMPRYVERQQGIHRLPYFVILPDDFDQPPVSLARPAHCFADLDRVIAFLGKFDQSLSDVELLPDWWEPG